MDLIVNNLRIPVEKDGINEYMLAAAARLQVSSQTLKLVRILSKSLDLSDKTQFFYEISLVVSTPEDFPNTENIPVYLDRTELPRERINRPERPIIIGFGPAGMFAALEFIENGIKPMIFERGRKIEERSADVQKFIKERILNPESNIQFGEGGAGSYSDGKLFSRRENSNYINKVLDTFIKFGAPEQIRYISKPHLGTDVLCRIVRNMRNYILERGGEIHYESKMTDLLLSGDAVQGVVINEKTEYRSHPVILALGHSARDTFELVRRKGVAVEQRPISVGVRIEHPADTINLIRYGEKYKNFPGIGNATYSFTYTDRKIGRGVYTFCMCPGGEVVNASSEQGHLVVNGMSYSGRSSAFSNAAMIATCRTTDYDSDDPLAGLAFQKEIERRAFQAGGGNWHVPAQNLMDFLGGRASGRLNSNSCRIGTAAADMKDIFPGFISEMLMAAFNFWKNDYPLFISDQAILLAAETRTSSPLKILRGPNYESVTIKNLYPIGEGSGYTGGITSSAADAIKAVEAMLASRV
ncbi:MAG: dehydrogenase [Thermodesulfovibrio sp.]|nr:dehydrogenase [Thermodesulfovibrio sp.]